MGQASKSSKDDENKRKKKGLFCHPLSMSLHCRPEFSYSSVAQTFHFQNKASSWMQTVRVNGWCLAHQGDGEPRFLLSQSGNMNKLISCEELWIRSKDPRLSSRAGV